jgi:hypothetical protein
MAHSGRGPARPADDRPVDPTPVDTTDLPPTPLRDRNIPAEAWIQAPEALKALGLDIGHHLVAYKREINGWLLWRAGPARRARSRYMAVARHDPNRRHTFDLQPDGTGEGDAPDGSRPTSFRAWKELLRDHPADS